MGFIQKYNRIALAVFITMGVIVFGYALYLISQSFWHRTDYNRDVLLPGEQASELTKKGLRKQIVSLGGIKWLDTANSYYFVPVTQTSLKNPELTESLSEVSIGYGGGGYGRNYNNILIYHIPSGNVQPLFSSRINIFEYQILRDKSTTLLLMIGWTEDSNQDGKLSEEDQSQVFYYSPDDRKLHEIDIQGYRYIDNSFVTLKDGLVLRVRKDRNQDGEFDEVQDRAILLHHSLADKTTKPIVSQPLLDQLQSIIDG